MLVVISNIVSENVERAVIRPSLLIMTVKEIVLSDEVTSTRVKTSRHVRGEEEVKHRTPSKVLDDQSVEGELSGDVEEDPSSRCLVTNESGS